jgi:hypothetical protein
MMLLMTMKMMMINLKIVLYFHYLFRAIKKFFFLLSLYFLLQ